MKLYNFFIPLFFLIAAPYISTAEFTISSYNCGGLPDHYDYLRSAAMQKLMQKRHIAEPKEMALNDKIQQLALKIKFAEGLDQRIAIWELKRYEPKFDVLIGGIKFSSIKSDSAPTNEEPAVPPDSSEVSYNDKVNWTKLAENMISDYKTRPVSISDSDVELMLKDHIANLTKIYDNDAINVTSKAVLRKVRDIMAERIFANELKYDIICLQEADYLKKKRFPEDYDVLFAETAHSKNGIAWNKNYFELEENLGDVMGRAFVVKLKVKEKRDNEDQRTVLIASAHLTGCNPFWVHDNDSEKGDNELSAIVELLNNTDADIKIIGMDSNVTSLHPRMEIIKKADYRLDYENFIDATCTNPYHVLNTRIDWIAVKGDATITNIPVLNVGLNSIQTNMSDHKPIAAKVRYN